MVPFESKDPCTGCTYTCYKPEPVHQKVQCTVWDCRAESREVICKACKCEPQVREMKRQVVIPECRPETVETVRRFCVMVPYQTTVKVAICVPCP
jgi:hypothetical protein